MMCIRISIAEKETARQLL